MLRVACFLSYLRPVMRARSCLIAACIGACAPPAFDDTRQPADTGSFGTIAHTLICKRVAYMADRADASPDEYLSVLTVDTDKNVVTAGIGYRLGKIRHDAMVGHAFMGGRDVARGTSCAPQLNPIRPAAGDCVHDDSPDHVYVGDGSYSSAWTFAGVGMQADSQLGYLASP